MLIIIECVTLRGSKRPPSSGTHTSAPCIRGLRILIVLGRAAPVEREPLITGVFDGFGDQSQQFVQARPVRWVRSASSSLSRECSRECRSRSASSALAASSVSAGGLSGKTNSVMPGSSPALSTLRLLDSVGMLGHRVFNPSAGLEMAERARSPRKVRRMSARRMCGPPAAAHGREPKSDASRPSAKGSVLRCVYGRRPTPRPNSVTTTAMRSRIT